MSERVETVYALFFAKGRQRRKPGSLTDLPKRRREIMAVIGIDLGTMNSLGTYWKDRRVYLIPMEYGQGTHCPGRDGPGGGLRGRHQAAGEDILAPQGALRGGKQNNRLSLTGEH